jgi:hypothetical protein
MALFLGTPKCESQNWVFYYLNTLDIHIFFKSNIFGTCGALYDNFKKDLSNGVLHTLIGDYLTPALRGFMVQSQIPNLTSAPSFGHNSCILGLHEQYENNLGVYTSRPFQCYVKGSIWCLFIFPTKALNIRNSHTSASLKVTHPQTP